MHLRRRTVFREVAKPFRTAHVQAGFVRVIDLVEDELVGIAEVKEPCDGCDGTHGKESDPVVRPPGLPSPLAGGRVPCL
jgi:hypothetical protein